MSFLLLLVILIPLVLIHEFGHFIAAKRAGIRVDEFGIGFPPRLFGKKFGETLYSFNWLPFGGFVKIFGEDPDDAATTGPDKARSFVYASKMTQFAVLAAGISFNVFFAWFLLSVSFMSGLPMPIDSDLAARGTATDPRVVVLSTYTDGPAAEAGVRTGDVVRGLTSGGATLTGEAVSVAAVQQFVAAHGSKEITLEYERSGERLSVPVTPQVIEESGVPDPLLGISMEYIGTVRLPLHRAVFEGGRQTYEFIGATAIGFANLIGQLFSGGADLSQVTGPVGIANVARDAAQFGIASLLSLTALISINLAVINLIPFPALDGGRLFFLLVEVIKRSPVSPRIANTANAIGFVLLILLMVAVTYHDIVRL